MSRRQRHQQQRRAQDADGFFATLDPRAVLQKVLREVDSFRGCPMPQSMTKLKAALQEHNVHVYLYDLHEFLANRCERLPILQSRKELRGVCRNNGAFPRNQAKSEGTRALLEVLF